MTIDFKEIPAISELSLRRARAFWQHLAWQLMPEAMVGAPGGDSSTPLPDASQAALLALVRGLHDTEVADEARERRLKARANLVALVEIGPADGLKRLDDDERPIGRLDLGSELLQLSEDARLALELIVVTATDPVTTHAARVLAGRVGRRDGQALGLLSDCWNAAGLGAGSLQGLCSDRGLLVRTGAVEILGAPGAEQVAPSATLLAFLDDRYNASSALREHEVQYHVPVQAMANFEEIRSSWLVVLAQTLRGNRPVLLSGRPGFGGPALLNTLANELKVPSHMVHVSPLVNTTDGRPNVLMTELHAQARLSGGLVVLHHLERLSEHFQENADSLRRFAEALIAVQRPIVLIHEGPVSNELASQLAVETRISHLPVPPLVPEQRRQILATCLMAGGTPADEADELAAAVASYSLGLEQLSTAALFAQQRAEQRGARERAERGQLSLRELMDRDEAAPEQDDVTEPPTVPTLSELRLACSTAATDRLRRYGSRVEGSASWDDLILPEETVKQLRNIGRFARVRDRLFDEYGFGAKHDYGRALSAMFSGPSGTGKTMCAGIIAREVGLELYRVDLSRVVSKYIGETEQRLGALFDEATQVGAALLFDEADSLFGKRTEIKSSHDRYANLEVNYLLQRLEEFDGLVILTTNFATSIDEAFVRRLRFRVEFPFPNPQDRAALWSHMLPPELPLDDDDPLELDWIGEAFELSGGHIKNTVLRAGMMTADREQGLSMRLLYDAAVAEYRELGKIAPAYAFEESDW